MKKTLFAIAAFFITSFCFAKGNIIALQAGDSTFASTATDFETFNIDPTVDLTAEYNFVFPFGLTLGVQAGVSEGATLSFADNWKSIFIGQTQSISFAPVIGYTTDSDLESRFIQFLLFPKIEAGDSTIFGRYTDSKYTSLSDAKTTYDFSRITMNFKVVFAWGSGLTRHGLYTQIGVPLFYTVNDKKVDNLKGYTIGLGYRCNFVF